MTDDQDTNVIDLEARRTVEVEMPIEGALRARLLEIMRAQKRRTEERGRAWTPQERTITIGYDHGFEGEPLVTLRSGKPSEDGFEAEHEIALSRAEVEVLIVVLPLLAVEMDADIAAPAPKPTPGGTVLQGPWDVA